MHNVLLGSAKHMMMLWKENKIVTEAHFTNIQAIVDKFVTPVDIGHIPYKLHPDLVLLQLTSGKTGA